jgi:hypothetical protein
MKMKCKSNNILSTFACLTILSTALGCGSGSVSDTNPDPDSVTIRLAWDQAEPERVTGYRLFMGETDVAEDMQLADEFLVAEQPGFDILAPLVEYDTKDDLGLEMGEHACFRLKAFNDTQESDFSNAACTTVNKTDGLVQTLQFGS